VFAAASSAATNMSFAAAAATTPARLFSAITPANNNRRGQQRVRRHSLASGVCGAAAGAHDRVELLCNYSRSVQFAA